MLPEKRSRVNPMRMGECGGANADGRPRAFDRDPGWPIVAGTRGAGDSRRVTNPADILMGGLALLAGLEVLLLTFRGALLRAGERRQLERQIEELKGDLQAARERTQQRAPELEAANARSEEALAALRKASTELAEAQVPRDVLVHKLGEPPSLVFRASLIKNLPAPPDANQVLLWSYKHLVDVYAADQDEAVQLASRSFAEQAGYVLGPFYSLGAEAAPRPPDEAEAGG